MEFCSRSFQYISLSSLQFLLSCVNSAGGIDKRAAQPPTEERSDKIHVLAGPCEDVHVKMT